MPFDASGNFTRVYNFVQDAANGIKILAARVDGEFDNIATGMNAVFFRDGRVPMQADLRMNINGITGLKDGALGSPAIKFNTDAGTGVYLPGLNQYGIQVNSVQRGVFTTAGLDVTGNLTATGTISEGGALLSGKYLAAASPVFTGTITGPGHVASGVAGSGFFTNPRDGTTGQTAIYSNTANTLRISQSATDQWVLSPSSLTVTPPATFSGMLTANSNARINGTGAGTALVLDDHLSSSGVNLQLNGNGSTTPNKTIRATNGQLQVANSAYSNIIFTLDDVGNITTRDVVASRGDGTGVLYFGGSGTNNYIQWDGTGYNFQGSGAVRANAGGFSALGAITVGPTAVGFSSSRSGSVGYHMYNGGGVQEWLMYQPTAAVDSDLHITTRNGGVLTDRLRVGVDGTITAGLHVNAGGELWTNGKILRFGGAGSSQYLYYDGFKFQLNGTLNTNGFDIGCANLFASGNITSSSDRRLKSNIRPFDDAVSIARKLRAYRFTMGGKQSVGVIAQELEAVLPELVSKDTNGMLAVDYGKIVSVLIADNNAMAERLTLLEAKVGA